jgi:hypothetical protein
MLSLIDILIASILDLLQSLSLLSKHDCTCTSSLFTHPCDVSPMVDDWGYRR